MPDNDQTEVIVAAAALVVSFIAFAATLMQCLQQYYASARGYSQCSEKVIGDWAKTKSRRFSFEELRFEVQFDAPVIFVCHPTNKNAPVPDAEMFKLDGTDKSLKDTWTTLKMSQREHYKERSPKERIHTSDNERASWTILLSAVQCMERESQEWHEKRFEYDSEKPPTEIFTRHSLPYKPPSLEESHTLVVALQRKRKSWDTMPATIARPYTTTTMCHLVEMLAAMGIYWKEFNRTIDRYRAEGNGFMVLGERVSDFGLMFNFQMNGLSRFGRNRVIPVDEIKELSFGWVPTIYRPLQQDKRRLEVPIDLVDLSSLQMGTKSEIAETLVMIGCNNNTVSIFETGRTSHLFPSKSRCGLLVVVGALHGLDLTFIIVSFEILGMLSRTFHIENTYFTYIPNPTRDRWDRRSVSLVGMMESFRLQFTRTAADVQRNQRIVNRLKDHMREILTHQGDQNVETLLRYRALHAALDDADEILTGRAKSTQSPPSPTSEQSEAHRVEARRSDMGAELRRRLTAMAGIQGSSPGPKGTESSTPSSKKSQQKQHPPDLNPETTAQRQRREKVQDVLRCHIQEVLRLLNERDDVYADQTLSVPPRLGRSHQRSRSLSPMPRPPGDTPTMDDVDAAGPDNRQYELMQLYCGHVRKLVAQNVAQVVDRRRASLQTIRTEVPRRGSEESSVSPLSPRYGAVPTAAAPPSPSTHPVDGSAPLPDIVPQAAGPSQGTLANETVYHDDIWCTLVFRMICWLMLHDFNKLDVQVPKSELLGSRMPVYVA